MAPIPQSMVKSVAVQKKVLNLPNRVETEVSKTCLPTPIVSGDTLPKQGATMPQRYDFLGLRFGAIVLLVSGITSLILGLCNRELLHPAWSQPPEATNALTSKPTKKLTKQELQFFETRVRPVLVEKCYACHSATSNLAEGGLRLDSRDAIRRGGSGGPALVPGEPANSLFIRAIEYRDADLAMPPDDAGGKLSDAEIKDLTRWVKMGAADPRDEDEAFQTVTASDTSDRSWWSLQPIVRPSLPTDTPWAWNSIDRFIADSHRQQALQPAADAPAVSLVRRLYFDLTGLPPTLEQQQDFEDKLASGTPRQHAIEELVDTLLASDAFGEHWGRHWLDVARYGESSGREVNLPYNQAWRYRDWVIDAVAKNQPYDAFLIEQIAGDLLTSTSPMQRADHLTATGFMALGSRNINEQNPKQFAVDQADEQIDTLFQATMATTFACARCHDHKFDPIPQSEYTAVSGIFLSTQTHFGVFGGNNARNGSPPLELPTDSHVTVLPSPWDAELIAKKHEELAKLRASIAKLQGDTKNDRKDKKVPKAVDRDKQQQIRKLTQTASELNFQLSAVTDEGNAKPLAMGLVDKPVADRRVETARKRPPSRPAAGRGRAVFASIDDSPFFARGDIDLPGEKIPRAVPNLFGDASHYEIPNNASGRLQLANWIASRDNPLTSRVAVNRMWAWLIGQGIVASVDNFGTSGSLPSHPQLLDHLAAEFIDNGWDVKQMVRRIATSRTYQLASFAVESNDGFDSSEGSDPDNRWCWRGKRRRLQAEEIRDAMLLLSNRLDPSRPMGTTMARHFGNRVNISTGKKRGKGEVLTDDVCRSIYLPLPRSAAPEVLELFDLPDGTFVQGMRDATNVPSQSLFLLNNPVVAGHAGAVVRTMMQRIPGRGLDNSEARANYLYRLILARPPTGDEMLLVSNLMKESETTEAGWISLVRGLFATAEFRYLD